MSEWSSSSKGRRGEASSRFTTLMSSVATCSRRLTSLLLCRILQFPRPVKLDDLRAKAKVAFGQTMDLHYTNNEVWSQKNSQTCTIFKISWNKKKKYIYTRVLIFFFSLQLVIPLTTQDDLDKAVELLDRSVHMKSLKILLVLQNLSQVSRFSQTAGKTPSALILNLRFTWIILLMMISSLVSVKFFVFLPGSFYLIYSTASQQL